MSALISKLRGLGKSDSNSEDSTREFILKLRDKISTNPASGLSEGVFDEDLYRWDGNLFGKDVGDYIGAPRAMREDAVLGIKSDKDDAYFDAINLKQQQADLLYDLAGGDPEEIVDFIEKSWSSKYPNIPKAPPVNIYRDPEAKTASALKSSNNLPKQPQSAIMNSIKKSTSLDASNAYRAILSDQVMKSPIYLPEPKYRRLFHDISNLGVAPPDSAVTDLNTLNRIPLDIGLDFEERAGETAVESQHAGVNLGGREAVRGGVTGGGLGLGLGILLDKWRRSMRESRTGEAQDKSLLTILTPTILGSLYGATRGVSNAHKDVPDPTKFLHGFGLDLGDAINDKVLQPGLELGTSIGSTLEGFKRLARPVKDASHNVSNSKIKDMNPSTILILHNPSNLKLASERPSADELLDTKGFFPAVGDVWFPWAGNRAGRAYGMSLAAGKDPDEVSSLLRYPTTTSSLGKLLGAGGGALLGAGGGALAGRTGTGAAVGGLTGGFLGALATAILRRRAINAAKEEFEAAEEVSPQKLKEYGLLENLLLPYAGPHRRGHSEINQDIRNNEVSGRPVRHGLNVANVVTGGYGAPLFGLADNLVADSRNQFKTASTPTFHVKAAEGQTSYRAPISTEDYLENLPGRMESLVDAGKQALRDPASAFGALKQSPLGKAVGQYGTTALGAGGGAALGNFIGGDNKLLSLILALAGAGGGAYLGNSIGGGEGFQAPNWTGSRPAKKASTSPYLPDPDIEPYQSDIEPGPDRPGLNYGPSPTAPTLPQQVGPTLGPGGTRDPEAFNWREYGNHTLDAGNAIIDKLKNFDYGSAWDQYGSTALGGGLGAYLGNTLGGDNKVLSTLLSLILGGGGAYLGNRFGSGQGFQAPNWKTASQGDRFMEALDTAAIPVAGAAGGVATSEGLIRALSRMAGNKSIPRNPRALATRIGLGAALASAGAYGGSKFPTPSETIRSLEYMDESLQRSDAIDRVQQGIQDTISGLPDKAFKAVGAAGGATLGGYGGLALGGLTDNKWLKLLLALTGGTVGGVAGHHLGGKVNPAIDSVVKGASVSYDTNDVIEVLAREAA